MENSNKKIRRWRQVQGKMEIGGEWKRLRSLHQGGVQLHANEHVKLTKQQKRDLKRNRKVNDASSSTAAAASIADNHTTPCEEVVKSAYKRETIYPPMPLMDPPSSLPGDFITSTSHPKYYQELLKTSYNGFIQSPSSSFKNSFHLQFQASLKGLEELNAYQYDITQPAGLGTKLAKTYVSRCLVGEPGITYKYLGIRMFSIPWDVSSVGASPHSIEVGKLNEVFVEHTRKLLIESGKAEIGSCNYNLTLINR